MLGSSIGLFKRDTRSLDYSAFGLYLRSFASCDWMAAAWAVTRDLPQTCNVCVFISSGTPLSEASFGLLRK